MGPTPRLIPTTPPHALIARARSFGSVKTFVIIDIANGIQHGTAHGLNHPERRQPAEARRNAAQ